MKAGGAPTPRPHGLRKMKIIRTVNELTEYVSSLRKEGRTIGLIPTMGALHRGHLSLIEEAQRQDATIVSVFVNPVQFNNPNDLATYPRNEEEDFRKLREMDVNAVFAPSVEEIYPGGIDGRQPQFDLGEVAEVMEGRYRPGHFQGVARIVNLLLRIVAPDRAYFGEKDFQQIAVIRRLTATEGIPVEIVSCPICRAADGLALSSRNRLLSEEQRKTAPEIHAALFESIEYSKNHSVQATHDTVVERLDACPGLQVEYFEIVDGTTLQPVTDWSDSDYIVGCITVYCGKVRLIDNITYRRPARG